MSMEISPSLIENDNVRIESDGNDVVLKETQSGTIMARYDDSAGAWKVGTDDSLGSVVTDDAFNSEIGDSVDYLDPVWLVESDADIINFTTWPSIDAWGENTAGSGNVTIANNGSALDLETGSTDDSQATLRWGIAASGSWNSWDSHEAESRLAFARNKIEQMFFARGNFEASVTNEHIGVGIRSDGDLIASVADGATRNTAVLKASADFSLNATFTIKWIHDASANEVTFYLDGSEITILSSNVPTSGNGLPSRLNVHLTNASTGGSDGRVNVHRFTMVKEP